MADEISERQKIRLDDNPWYLLATLYGEPSDGDAELQARNRMAWNRCMASEIGDELRSNLIETGRHSAEELTPFSQDELQAALAKRSGTSMKIEVLLARVDFSNVEFDKPFFAHRFVFPASAIFCNATFSRYAEFGSATFSGSADFESATFSGLADFTGATFSGSADFTSATFSRYAEFGSATFSGSADFESATFSGLADYTSATFSGSADFESATFSGSADFESATFSGLADFRSATFSGIADFRSATFSGIADFRSAIFSSANFGSTTFSRYAGFGSATFSGLADFRSATFSGLADFRSATLSGLADFESATFSGNTVFRNTRFSSAVLFVNFVNAEMKSDTEFDGAKFSAPPRFFGAKLHEGTTWHSARWPKPPKDIETAARFVDAYERLKLEMDRLKKHEDELDFFARELQSRRVMRGLWRGLPIALYGALCDYGRSYVRPLAILVATVAAGAVPVWAQFGGFAATTLASAGRKLSVGEAIGLSFANAFGVFGVRKDLIDPHLIEILPGWLKVTAALQTGLGIVLLFLFSLSLRNRFRMR
jgi:Pentapeptide repeats (9 copies)